ncbi:hypothetical protein OG497_38035 [Streptomyces sp. NBC_01242]|uniref:hypothetical protein n=1 Tax=Streptomyces sp. NBC_01242 TaxID=2903795 RepID=UPI002259DB7A|nr:hypothetical protein [Streptomyces sp. NBC_01242]MCX4799660.1 hypothetical protein [Streptomyces sp. NBC_01242]
MPTHWHAYSYNGRSYTDAMIRRGEVPAAYPPIEIKHWLARPANHVVETFHEVDPAVSWLEGELNGHPPVDAESFPVKVRVAYSRKTLQQTAGNDVVYGYYSKSQYVSRALIACPRHRANAGEEAPPGCPQGM